MNKKILCFFYILPLRVLYVLKKRVNQQETLRNLSVLRLNYLTSDEGSSEAIRNITYNFDNYFNLLPLHKKKINKNFLQWFIGFTEGAGSFIILNNIIFFGIKKDMLDIQTLYFIKKELGFGKIMFKAEKTKNVGIFYVSGKDNF